MSEIAAIEHDMEVAGRLIDAARDLLTTGNLIDLEGLGQRIEALCGEITKLSGLIQYSGNSSILFQFILTSCLYLTFL